MQRRWRRFMLGGALLLTGCCIVVAVYPRAPKLLDRATLVADIRIWDADQQDSYTWLTDRQLLHFQADGSVCRYDAAIHADTPLTALTDRIKTSKAESVVLQASRDGKWVLWGEGDARIFTAAIDGASLREWRTPANNSHAYWLPQGGRWTQWDYKPNPTAVLQIRSTMNAFWTTFTLHDVEKSSVADQRLKLPADLKNQEVLTVLSPERVVTRTPDQVTLKQLGPRAYNMLVNYREIQDVSIWSLDGAVPVQHYRVRLPGLVFEAAAATDGRRVAWLVEIENKTQSSGPLRRLIRRFEALQTSRSALYVSDLDGTNLHEIGYVGVGTNDYLPFDIRWLPDNRYLSFLYRDRLWKVAAD
jgi:hypothetical protein